MIATSVGDFPLVQMLLHANADPNIPNANEQIPMHYAASKNRLEVSLSFFIIG
jgi:ankyrin repeat protein